MDAPLHQGQRGHTESPVKRGWLLIREKMVTVTFKFNKEKLKEYGKTEDELLNPFREDLKPWTVSEIALGVFQKDGQDALVILDFPLMYIRKNLYYLQLLDEWTLDIDGDIENCKEELINYYRENGQALE